MQPAQRNPGVPRRLLSLGVLLLSLLTLLALLSPLAQAQSGGGFGGSSRSSGSSGSSGGSFGGSGSSRGGGYSGGGYSGGGYSGPIIINGGGGYGYSSGGGGGLITMIIFGVVIFVVISGMRRSLGGGGRGLAGLSGTAQALSVQILMAEGDEVKRALQRVAQTGDPDTNEGLTRMMQEAALVVLRHPERWVYGNVQRAQGAANTADSQVGAWATEARAAFTEQTTSNYQNNDPASGYARRDDYTFKHDAADQYLAVTLAVAARTPPDSRWSPYSGP
ncbi:DUF1517 domain-containing protein, partial [Deinococcus sp. 14RED07]|uniref:DUF1517 domain-containing protein n=1 Tax=Deinococcus sp. 14RED07 TaxID=2745874 RepID=UPI001E56114B